VAHVEELMLGGRRLSHSGHEVPRAAVWAGVVANQDRNLSRRVGQDAAQAAHEVLVTPVYGDADNGVATLGSDAPAGL
jgi:hypothetical protein